MRVADRKSERVGRVERNPLALPRQKRQNHGADLLLLRVSVADERLLDEAGLVLEHRNPGARRGRQQNSTGVRELDRGGDVTRRKDGLDRGSVRMSLGQELLGRPEEELELLGERKPRARPPDPAGDEAEATFRKDDDSEPGRDGPRIEADDLHENRELRIEDSPTLDSESSFLNSWPRSPRNRNSTRRSARRRGLRGLPSA